MDSDKSPTRDARCFFGLYPGPFLRERFLKKAAYDATLESGKPL